MLQDIVGFLASCVYMASTFAELLFERTGTWPLVFAAISIVLISRFLLGPVLGFTASGASDMVKSRRRSKE